MYDKYALVATGKEKVTWFSKLECDPPEKKNDVKPVVVILVDEGVEKLGDILPECYASTGNDLKIYAVFLMDGRFWLLDPLTGRVGFDGKTYHGYEITEFVKQYALM